MDKEFETRELVGHRAQLAVGRRSILKRAGAHTATFLGAAVVLSGCGAVQGSTSNANEGAAMQQTQSAAVQLTQEWDKTFPKSDRVDHQKVTFRNRYGFTLAADVY